jgi:transglutaminase-like putative cysteine protease
MVAVRLIRVWALPLAMWLSGHSALVAQTAPIPPKSTGPVIISGDSATPATGKATGITIVSGSQVQAFLADGTNIPGTRFRLEMRPCQRVEGVYSVEFTAPRKQATAWIVKTPRAPELPYQTDVRSVLEPGGHAEDERSELKRQVLTAVVPASADGKGLSARVKHQATIWSRRLVPLGPGEVATPCPPLTSAERKLALRTSPSCDFQSDYYQSWQKSLGLARGKGERDLDFARRVFLVLHQSFSYAKKPAKDLGLRPTLETHSAACADLSNVFVAVMRANDVPARVVAGWHARSQKPDEKGICNSHAKAEFFADGVGWVPVEAAGAASGRVGAGNAYFGFDQGDFLVVHVDIDLLLGAGPHTVSTRFLTHTICWSNGSGDYEGSSQRDTWQVRVLK